MKLASLLHPFLIPRHLLRALMGPFLFSLCTLMFLFLLHFVMKYIDQLVGKGLSGWVILELIVLNLAWMVVLAVPMSVLVATLMAFGDLSQNNEVTAMRAGGMSILVMARPVLIAAGTIAVLLVLFNNHVLPEANHRAKILSIDIRQKRPTLNIVAGYFSQDIPGYSILARKTFEASNNLEGITLYDHTRPTTNAVITAKRGRISFSPDFQKLILDLEEGEIHELQLQDMQSYRTIAFTNHRIAINVEGFEFERSSEGAFSRGDRELSAQTMLHIVDSLKQVKAEKETRLLKGIEEDFERRLSGKPDTLSPLFPRFNPGRARALPLERARSISAMVQNEVSQVEFIGKQIDQYWVEIHKKYSIPAACIVFVMVGIPLGVIVRRGGFGMAATMSLGFFILYWACLIGGEKLADRGILSPLWGMWSANVIIGAIGLYLLLRKKSHAIAPNLDWVRRLVPAAWRSEPESGTTEAS
jgi:lipopolysaccharide export system permease protein